MKIRIKIRTPKGQAEKLLPKLKPFLLGINRKQIKKSEAWVNDNGDEMYLEIEGSLRKVMDIQRNMTFFDTVMKYGMKSKKIRKLAGFKSDDKKEKEIDKLLENHTKIEIIKNTTANEIVEANKTFWQRMKENFRKLKK
jgi:hypothetical protein